MKWLKTACMFVLWIGISACLLLPPTKIAPVTGRVLDQDTGQPVAGAIVVVRWIGTATKAFVDQHTACYHVETAKTDAEGIYETTSWLEASKYQDLGFKGRRIMVYKAGYRYVSSKDEFHYLEQDTRSADQRLDYLFNVAVKCDLNAENQKKLLVLYTAIYDEAQRIAETKQEKIKALHHLKRIEWITLGSTEAWTRFYARSRELR